MGNLGERFIELVGFAGVSSTSGQYIYHQLNIKQFYILPTQCIYVFCVDLRTNSDYFPTQHNLRSECARKHKFVFA
jgi:hypothetical protein